MKNMKKKILYWIPTALLLLVMMGSAISYFVDPQTAITAFGDLGYPSYTVYFNAIAKLIGGLALILPMAPKVCKEWAYAGYLFILMLATQAILMRMPEMAWPMVIFFILWALSYWQWKQQTR